MLFVVFVKTQKILGAQNLNEKNYSNGVNMMETNSRSPRKWILKLCKFDAWSTVNGDFAIEICFVMLKRMNFDVPARSLFQMKWGTPIIASVYFDVYGRMY